MVEYSFLIYTGHRNQRFYQWKFCRRGCQWNMTQSPLYYRYEDTAQGKAFSGLGKNFVRELYSEIENKKEYEFLRGNKELESIFEEHLK